jgi:hypothetical protein
MMLNSKQTVHNIRVKVRLISERIWRREGWGVCTGDLERYFIMREIDVRGGFAPQPLPDEVRRALLVKVAGGEG